MQSKTWCFNWTVLRKDITRYAPLWGVYCALLLLLQVSSLVFNEGWRNVTLALDYLRTLGPLGNLIYSAVCVSQLLGDLYKPQLCNTLHTMPLRREGWFLTHITAGLLFSIVPNTAAALLMLPFLGEFGVVALLWLAVMILQYIVFFGIAVFAAMCAGNRLGFTAVLVLLHNIPALVYGLFATLVEPIWYGVRINDDLLQIAPLTGLMSADYLEYTANYNAGTLHLEGMRPEDWIYLGVWVVLSVALIGIALLMYRRRKLETAGDFLAVKAVKPVFLAVYTLTICMMLSGLANGELIGLVIGYLTGLMLLNRTVKIFKWKNIRNGLIGAGVITIGLVLILLDPLGIKTYVPQRSEISQMYVYYQYLEGSNVSRYAIDEDEIEDFMAYHVQAIEEETQLTSGNATALIFHYVLEDGKEVKRYYYVSDYSSMAPAVIGHLSNYQLVLDTDKPFAEYEKQIVVADFTSTSPHAYQGAQERWMYGERKTQLLQAVFADCEEGTMMQQSRYHAAIIGKVMLLDTNGNQHNIFIYSDNVNVLAFLQTFE